jgi:hypothetical protein
MDKPLRPDNGDQAYQSGCQEDGGKGVILEKVPHYFSGLREGFGSK